MPAAPPRLLLPLCLLLLILPLLPDAARGAEDAVWVARRLQAALAAKHAANTTTSTTNSRPLAPQHAPPARSVAPALLAALRDREAQTAVLCDDAHALLAQWLLRRGDGRRWRIHALRQPLRPRDLAVPRVVLVAEFGAARRVLQRWAAADLAQPRWILGPAAGAAYATLPAVLRARLGSVEALQPRLGDPRAIRAAAGFARAWQSVAMQRWPADVRAAAAEDLSRMEVAEDEDACWRRFQGFESQPLDDADASWVFADAAVLQPNASQQGLFWDDGQAILEADAVSIAKCEPTANPPYFPASLPQLLQQLGAPYGWLDAVVVAESVATVMRASQPNFSGLEWALSTLSDGHSALALDLARRDDLLSLAADLLSSNGTTVHSHDNCPHHSYILPLIVGILALLAVLSILYYCGRKHIGASLFEQTLRAERDAQVARQNAEIKASFLANMSHEIRTPLHAILSMGRMLMESRQMDPNADAQDLEDLAQIIRSSETLEALVNDVLFISKMQTSSFTLVNKPFDVCEMMEDVTQLLSLRWESKVKSKRGGERL